MIAMADWVNELDYFLRTMRKDMKDCARHEKAIEHAKEEYKRYKNRFLDQPTEKERVYIARTHQLFAINRKGNKMKALRDLIIELRNRDGLSQRESPSNSAAPRNPLSARWRKERTTFPMKS